MCKLDDDQPPCLSTPRRYDDRNRQSRGRDRDRSGSKPQAPGNVRSELQQGAPGRRGAPVPDGNRKAGRRARTARSGCWHAELRRLAKRSRRSRRTSNRGGSWGVRFAVPARTGWVQQLSTTKRRPNRTPYPPRRQQAVCVYAQQTLSQVRIRLVDPGIRACWPTRPKNGRYAGSARRWRSTWRQAIFG